MIQYTGPKQEHVPGAMDTSGLAAREPDPTARYAESANPGLSMPAQADEAGDWVTSSLKNAPFTKLTNTEPLSSWLGYIRGCEPVCPGKYTDYQVVIADVFKSPMGDLYPNMLFVQSGFLRRQHA